MRPNPHQPKSPAGGEAMVFAAIILAAGRSSRMGCSKPLLPWGDTTVLGHLIRQWQTIGARQVAVVAATAARDIQSELDRLGFPGDCRILNSSPERGMFGSIRCAAGWNGWQPNLTHWVVVLGDQPHLRTETLRQLLFCGAAQPDRIWQPLRGGRRLHPVLIPKPAFSGLNGCADATLKEFLAAQGGRLAGFACDDPGVELDMDTPADYELARRICLGPGS